MPLARSLAVFVLSLLFTTSISMAITSYTVGSLIQKEAFKTFIKSKINLGINQECQNQCDQNQYMSNDTCMQFCISQSMNQTQTGLDKVFDEIYQKQIFNTTLNEISSFLSYYILFFVIGIITGILILIVSKTPFLTLGKSLISISILNFITSFIPQFIFASVNLPFDLGQAITDYFSSGFNQHFIYGVVLLIVGIILVIVNYLLDRRKNKEPDKKDEPDKKKDEDKNKK